MTEPSRRTSRLALASGLTGAIVFAALGFAVGRSSAPQPASSKIAPMPPHPAPASEPIAPSVFGRTQLIDLARAGADAFAGGTPAASGHPAPVGRRFELRLPFGCYGPGDPKQSPIGWRYDPKTETLRVWARPTEWEASDWLAPEASTSVESVEGFWVDRPWTSSEQCPGSAGQPIPPSVVAPLPEPTLGIAEFTPVNSSRVGQRRGDPFTAVEKLRLADLDLTRGLRLRLSGRVGSTPDGRSVACRSGGGEESRPVCLVAVTLDEVSIENGATGEALGTWTVSQPPGAGAAAE